MPANLQKADGLAALANAELHQQNANNVNHRVVLDDEDLGDDELLNPMNQRRDRRYVWSSK